MSDIDSITNWDDFVNKISAIRSEKLVSKLPVGAITNLLFGGAMDSLLASRLDTKGRIEVYKEAFEEVKKAAKSKASLPKKTKTAVLGIADIKTDAHLAMWRQSNSPMGVYRFIHSLADNLKIFGFQYSKDRDRYQMMSPEGPHLIFEEVSRIFATRGTEFWGLIKSRKYHVHLIGVVSKCEVRRWANDSKEMMKVSIFTGIENIEDIVIWPEYGENHINSFFKTQITVGNLYLFQVMPNFKEGRESISIEKIKVFQV